MIIYSLLNRHRFLYYEGGSNLPEFQLSSPYKPRGDQIHAIKHLVKDIKDGKKFQTLLGVTGSGKTFTIANVIEQTQKPTLIISHNKTLAAQLYQEFKEYFPNNAVEYFVSFYDYYQPEAYLPTPDRYIEKDFDINEEIDKMRASTTRSLLERDDVIVIASVSCIYGLGKPEWYESLSLNIRRGMIRSKKQILSDLVDILYERNEIALTRGTFRAKGDTIDIWPVYEDNAAVRIELFGDEVDPQSTMYVPETK
jgi:excinuclease ABC subunit B